MGEAPVFRNAERSKQVISLFAFLLLNRFDTISNERLIEALWPEDDSDDPVNALKNLVYRLRKILSSNKILNGNDCVLSKNGTYAWNCDIPCTIDAEEMDNLYRKAKDEKLSVDIRIGLYKDAIALYKGRFLEDFFFEGWAVPLSSYYQSLYMNCIREVTSLLDTAKRYDEIIFLCETAIAMEPYEEVFHENLLKALINSGQKRKALEHYNNISRKFYRESGVKLCNSIRCLHKELVRDLREVETDITAIKEEMHDPVMDGAFLCDIEIFMNIYRLETRTAERAGQSVFICLLTISSSIQTGGIGTILYAMDKLENVIVSSLRKGDVVSRFSTTQFVLLLPVSYENGEKVIERILNRFMQEYRNPVIKIDVTLEPVI